jgi:hypothetical protein
VFDLVKVTDEEIEVHTDTIFDMHTEEVKAYKIASEWSRDLSQSKIEKLLLPKVDNVCHICGGDTDKHTPDCTSFVYGITNGKM